MDIAVPYESVRDLVCDGQMRFEVPEPLELVVSEESTSCDGYCGDRRLDDRGDVLELARTREGEVQEGKGCNQQGNRYRNY